MKRKYDYTQYETAFIIKNYPLYGSKFIFENLKNLTVKSLSSFIFLNKLKIKYEKIKIDTENKYLCYMLGLLWADGTVSLSDRNRFCIKILEDDIINIKDILYKVCDWKYQLNISKNIKWKNSVRLSYTDKNFKNFLIENDYLEKSKISPYKILSKIPDYNKKYFYRGIIDGDGCFFVKKYKTNISRLLTITSTYDQNWDYMIELCDKIGCKFYIKKVVNNKEKNHTSSVFIISSSYIVKFGTYLYEDLFGLERKYYKYLEIKNSYINKKFIKL